MIQYLVKNQVDRIQCNDTGKHTYETLVYLYKGKPTPLKLDWPPESPDNQYHLNK